MKFVTTLANTSKGIEPLILAVLTQVLGLQNPPVNIQLQFKKFILRETIAIRL
jgi:hypothetical protein